jgi:glycosyltransferase involved in cell wall biosynthesis
MGGKRIAVLHAQIPFERSEEDIRVESLTEQLRFRGFDAELIEIPFKWYPTNSLMDSILAWRTVDLTQSNGENIDLVIPTVFPTYAVKHPNKVLWLVHQYRQAYKLSDLVDYGGIHAAPEGLQTQKNIINIDNCVLPECKGIYTISQNVSKQLFANNGLHSIALYSPPKHAGKYFSKNYDKYIFTVGRLDPLKRNSLLIEAMQYCDKSIKAYIAGTGVEMELLKELADKKGVSDRVNFLGHVSDSELLGYYSNASSVYYAPVDEDYGYITLEAFLSKKPVITCDDTGGVLEFVEDRKNGLICTVDPQQIGQAMNALCLNPKLSSEYGNNGYEAVKDIKWDTVIDKLTQSIR